MELAGCQLGPKKMLAMQKITFRKILILVINFEILVMEEGRSQDGR